VITTSLSKLQGGRVRLLLRFTRTSTLGSLTLTISGVRNREVKTGVKISPRFDQALFLQYFVGRHSIQRSMRGSAGHDCFDYLNWQTGCCSMDRLSPFGKLYPN